MTTKIPTLGGRKIALDARLRTSQFVCSSCNKHFPDMNALQQHTAMVHGTGELQRLGLPQLQVATPRRRSRVRSRSLPARNQLALYKPQVNPDGSGKAYTAVDDVRYGSTATNNYSGSVERPLGSNPRWLNALAGRIGSTPNGRAWALAALHPCGVNEDTQQIGELVGMPDTMTGAVATPSYRGENHLTYATSLFPTPPPNPTTYGIDIIIPPVPEIDYMYRLIDDSTATKSPWVVVRLPDYQLPNYATVGDDLGYTNAEVGTTMSSAGYGKVRLIGKGHTIELDAAGLNDQGRIVVGQVEGQWLHETLSVPQVKTTTASFVTDVGPPPVTATALTGLTNSGPEDTTELWLLAVPTDPAVIVANCPNAYQGLAKHGAYVISKFTNPLLGYQFKRTGGNTNYSVDGVATTAWPYMPTSAMAVVTSPNFVAQPNLTATDDFVVTDNAYRSGFSTIDLPIDTQGDASTILGSSLHPWVSAPSDMTTSVVLVRNLPTGNTNGITSSLRIKSRNYIEAISNAVNPAVAPYVHPPAQFDFQAINSVIVAGKQMGDAYPACENSFGTVMKRIWGFLAGTGRQTAKIVSGMGLPIVSPLAGAIDAAFGAFE